MFRDADTEIEEDNSDSKLGLSSPLRVETDINHDLGADFVHMESEDQDSPHPPPGSYFTQAD